MWFIWNAICLEIKPVSLCCKRSQIVVNSSWMDRFWKPSPISDPVVPSFWAVMLEVDGTHQSKALHVFLGVNKFRAVLPHFESAQWFAAPYGESRDRSAPLLPPPTAERLMIACIPVRERHLCFQGSYSESSSTVSSDMFNFRVVTKKTKQGYKNQKH